MTWLWVNVDDGVDDGIIVVGATLGAVVLDEFEQATPNTAIVPEATSNASFRNIERPL
jgi:hypothetical protein